MEIIYFDNLVKMKTLLNPLQRFLKMEHL